MWTVTCLSVDGRPLKPSNIGRSGISYKSLAAEAHQVKSGFFYSAAERGSSGCVLPVSKVTASSRVKPQLRSRWYWQPIGWTSWRRRSQDERWRARWDFPSALTAASPLTLVQTDVLNTLCCGVFRCTPGPSLWFTLWKSLSVKSVTTDTTLAAGNPNCWAACTESVPSVWRRWSTWVSSHCQVNWLTLRSHQWQMAQPQQLFIVYRNLA